MSGGYIDPQQDGDHQVVIFTIIGDVSQTDKDYWNQAVANLKAKFPKLASVTLGGKPTPPSPPLPGSLAAP
jgi:hypothetical protein